VYLIHDTDVSKEQAISIFKAKEEIKQETGMKQVTWLILQP
jgi:hypothetical protein